MGTEDSRQPAAGREQQTANRASRKQRAASGGQQAGAGEFRIANFECRIGGSREEKGPGEFNVECGVRNGVDGRRGTGDGEPAMPVCGPRSSVVCKSCGDEADLADSMTQ